MTQADPDPDNTTGLEPGGGVPPGETPPGEGSVAGAATHHEPPAGRAGGRVALIVIAVLVVMVVLFVLGRAASLFG